MRKYGLSLVLALLLILLFACAENRYVKSGDSAAAAPVVSESTATAVTASDAAAADAVTAEGVTEASPDVSAAISPETKMSEAESSPDAAPQKPLTETGSIKPSPSPEKSAAPDSTAEQPTAATPQNSPLEQPPLMTKLIQDAGLIFDDLTFSQLVIVAAKGAYADLYCYDKDGSGQWKLHEGLGYIKGYVGRNGVSDNKSEGDGCTPSGLFSFGYAFGNSPKPETQMEFRAVTAESYWVDDPNSKYYNQWVEGTADADWSSAEHLSEYKKYYAYAVVVEYNTSDTVAGKGSAIFLHCKNVPTTGCIAVPEESMLKILKWLSPDKNPSILIASQ